MLSRLWNDETGAVLSAELALVSTIVVIGAVTGLASLRDALVTEFADIAAAVGTLDQSYTVPGAIGVFSATATSTFTDLQDQGDSLTATAANSNCITICNGLVVTSPPGNEGRGLN